MPYKSRHQELACRRRIYADRRVFIDSLKDVPCHDCGGKYPPYVMDFDHVNGEKRRVLSRMAHYSPERILEEAAKCDVVCANCHRIRSHVNDVYQAPKFGHDFEPPPLNYDWVSDGCP